MTWIDVTDLTAWQGPPTGIPRVVYNLATRYATRPDVRLFAYSEARGFRTVDANVVVGPEAARRWRPVRRGPSRLRTLGARVTKRIVTELRRGTPLVVKNALRDVGWAGRTLGERFGRSAGLPLPVTALPAVQSHERARPLRMRSWPTTADGEPIFRDGDCVLVLGAGWAKPGLQGALTRLKVKTRIEIYQVIYDLTPVLLPQCFGPGFPEDFARYLFEAVSVSSGLVAISDHSRADTLRFCERLLLAAPPIEVVRLGDDPGTDHAAPEPVEAVTNSEFVLAVGTFEARKNYQLLYQVWKLAAERGVALPRLVIVGRLGWAARDTLFAITRDPDVRDSILVLQEASDGQLEWLYEKCLFAVYPSLYEGWGLPIAEALARGKVCVASAAAAMPEVAGDLIDYFSPFDAAACLEQLERYLDPAARATKEVEIKRSYTPTTWDMAFVGFEQALGRIRASRS